MHPGFTSLVPVILIQSITGFNWHISTWKFHINMFNLAWFGWRHKHWITACKLMTDEMKAYA